MFEFQRDVMRDGTHGLRRCPAARPNRRQQAGKIVRQWLSQWIRVSAQFGSRYWDAAWATHAKALGAIDGDRSRLMRCNP